MARYVARIASPWSVERTFDFMADMRQFARWDPSVRRVEQVRGDGGGVDAAWDVTVGGPMGDVTLHYQTVAFERPGRVVLRAVSPRLESLDEVTVEAAAQGALIVYDAQLWTRGLFAPFSPLVGLLLRNIGNRAVRGLRELLAREA